MNLIYSGHKPEHYNLSLPDDYKFAKNSWGDSFYKVYEPMRFLDAIHQCESDGAYMADPKSHAENNFIAGILSEYSWIGINDIDQEGKFVRSSDGLQVSYTNWGWGEPNNVNQWDGAYGEDAVAIHPTGEWNDASIYNEHKFVCYYRIESSSQQKRGLGPAKAFRQIQQNQKSRKQARNVDATDMSGQGF